jgi:hypothetical protein
VAPAALLAALLAPACAPGSVDAADVEGVEGVGEADGQRDAVVAATTAPVELLPVWLEHLPDGPLVDVEGPAIVACGQGGLLSEGTSLEIRTAWCDPADVMAPLPADVVAGARLDLTLVHSALVADGGQAHFAVFVGDELVWEQHTPLPAPAAFLAPRVALRHAHAAGEPVVVHVHNHGSNAYTIHGLRFLPPAD